MHEVFGPRLQLVTGKGGVGKSTVVAALALALAREGRRPLVVELGHRATLQSFFPGHAITFEPAELERGVFAMNMELEGALVDYAARWVRFRKLARMAIENPQLDRFLRAAPGVVETVTLAKLQSLLEKEEADGPRWDPILVDLDATGHALMLLELPKVLEGLLGSGPLRRMLSQAVHLMSDHEMTRIHLVSVPRDLVVQETRELYERLTREHAVRFGALFVNQVPRAPLSPEASELLEAVEDRARRHAPELLAVLAVARAAMKRHERAESHARALAEAVPLTTLALPSLPADMPVRQIVYRLSREMATAPDPGRER